MAHFAKIDTDGNVLGVLAVSNDDIKDPEGDEKEVLGQTFLFNLTGHRLWKQTSYNGNFRKNYAGIGYKYDSARDAFIAPKPFDSLILNEETCKWESLVPFPKDGEMYNWNEETISWVLR